MKRPHYFVDASAWIAYFLYGEPQHDQVKELLVKIIKEGATISTSCDVIDETVTRLITSTNLKLTKKFIEYIKEGIKIGALVEFFTDEQIQEEAFGLIVKFAEHQLSLTDSTSVVFFRRYKMKAIVTLDQDFVKVGIPTKP